MVMIGFLEKKIIVSLAGVFFKYNLNRHKYVTTFAARNVFNVSSKYAIKITNMLNNFVKIQQIVLSVAFYMALSIFSIGTQTILLSKLQIRTSSSLNHFHRIFISK